MEQFAETKEIRDAVADITDFLISIVPVPWERICFYAECVPGTANIWFAVAEEGTGIVCTEFRRRYASFYTLEYKEIRRRLIGLAVRLHIACSEIADAEKNWRCMYFTVDVNGDVHIDYTDKPLSEDFFDNNYAVCEYFFGPDCRKCAMPYPASSPSY